MNQNPWCESGESGTIQTTFEDNFASSASASEKLPDSKEYLESLGEFIEFLFVCQFINRIFLIN